jgi:hypothetical protein
VDTNVDASEYVPRILIAGAAGMSAAFVRHPAVRGLLLAAGGGLLTTVALSYCPCNAILGRTAEEPEWRTLKTWRVEA